MVNELRRLATLIDDLPVVGVSPDPYDNFLLAMAGAVQTDVFVSGTSAICLRLRHIAGRALTARAAVELANS